MGPVGTALIDWGMASTALAGEAESGDRCVVQPTPSGVLVAVVDGLGHGQEAAAAAKLAAATVERHAAELPISLLRRCHERLRTTRGVVMSLASLNGTEGTMTWLGVGNVEGLLLRADPQVTPAQESLLLRRGVVGGRLPSLSASIIPLARGDTLVFATDGIRNGFHQGLNVNDPPQQIARRILAQHQLGTDDALVLVARYLGEQS